MQKNNCKRLEIQERENISRGLVQKKTIQAIAREINRSPNTIRREIKRNSGESGFRAFLSLFLTAIYGVIGFFLVINPHLWCITKNGESEI